MNRSRTPNCLERFSAILLLVFLNLGCSTTALEARIDYWKAQTAAHLPIGASKQQAEEFFNARGAKLVCCMKASGPNYHYMMEREVSRGLVMKYDLVVMVDISSNNTVRSVSVQTLGVGF